MSFCCHLTSMQSKNLSIVRMNNRVCSLSMNCRALATLSLLTCNTLNFSHKCNEKPDLLKLLNGLSFGKTTLTKYSIFSCVAHPNGRCSCLRLSKIQPFDRLPTDRLATLLQTLLQCCISYNLAKLTCNVLLFECAYELLKQFRVVFNRYGASHKKKTCSVSLNGLW